MLATLAPEPWFEKPPPAGDELASIIVWCNAENEQTLGCLESLLQYTHTPFEIILVSNGPKAVKNMVPGILGTACWKINKLR